MNTQTLNVSAVTGANDGQLYRCILRSGGSSMPSRIARLRVNSPANVTAVKTEPIRMHIPDNRRIIIDLGTAQPNSGYHIYDGAGRKVLSGSLDAARASISTESLAPGIYTLRVTAPGRRAAFKVLR